MTVLYIQRRHKGVFSQASEFIFAVIQRGATKIRSF